MQYSNTNHIGYKGFKTKLNLQGQKFGRLLVLKIVPTPKGSHTKWECKCDCGKIKTVTGSELLRRHVTSCGCYNKMRLFRGDKVGYGGLHKWVRRELGKASVCVYCGSIVNIVWANISHTYKRDLSDWMSLCCKCHAKYDGIGEKAALTKRLRYGTAI